MTGPRVSICIPGYGRPRELRQAIESVLSQGLEDLEVVVGDDSGDLEDAALASGDARVRYFRNPSRLGMAGNWNAVLDRSRGGLVGLLMDDDRLLPGYLESTVPAFAEDRSLGVAFTNHQFDDGGELRERASALPAGRYDSFLLPLLEHMPVPVSSALMRREVWEQVRPLPALATADVVLHVRAAEAGWAFRYIDRPLMAYRVHAGQLSSNRKFRDDRVRAWELFAFDDPRCEELRRRHLADALVSRAAVQLRLGRAGPGRDDLERAAELHPASIGARARVLRQLARHPRIAPAVFRALEGARLISTER